MLRSPSMAVLLLAAAASCTSPATETPLPEAPAPTAQHAWLQPLVGTWDLIYRADAPDGSGPMEWTGTEVVSSIGTNWVVAVSEASSPQGGMTGRLTIGYDVERETYVGTWIDSIQTNLWTYDATLDEAGRTLSLVPTIEPRAAVPDPKRFRDEIELVDDDHRVLTSWYQGDDGAWVQYLVIEATRAD